MDGKLINGILLVDKPLGISSARVIAKIKKRCLIPKIGHTGTLDPLASGMLPVSMGHATKISQYLLDQSKCYRMQVLLGEQRATDDLEGEIIFQGEVPELTPKLVDDILQKFVGQIQQLPPIYSAIKHKGKALYHYARAGEAVDIKLRQVEIHDIKVEKIEPTVIQLLVYCSKGSYMRSLARDMGELLGCGGCVKQLHRLWCSPYQDQKMIALDTLLEGSNEEFLKEILPTDSAIPWIEQVLISPLRSTAFCQGLSTKMPSSEETKMVRVYAEETFLGIGLLDKGELKPKRILCATC